MTIKTQQIIFGDICVDVEEKNIKNLHLRVYAPAGRVRITAPRGISMEMVRIFVSSKLEWIKRHQSRVQRQVRPRQAEYVSLEGHYYAGRRYLLNVIFHNAPPKVELRDSGGIDLYVRQGCNLEQRKKAMTNWYRRQLKDRIPAIIEKWQKIMGVEINEWGVKQMKTRWGTCAIRARRIWINLELAKKPEYCLEYIVVHEMLHLIERKHNDRFAAHMDRFIPQWRGYKDELNSRAAHPRNHTKI